MQKKKEKTIKFPLPFKKDPYKPTNASPVDEKKLEEILRLVKEKRKEHIRHKKNRSG